MLHGSTHNIGTHSAQVGVGRDARLVGLLSQMGDGGGVFAIQTFSAARVGAGAASDCA